jgi:hypothetical protein
MKYVKPEVVKLTDALSAVQGMSIKGWPVYTEVGSDPYFKTQSAYEADE